MKKQDKPIPVKTARELWAENGAGKVPSLKDAVDELIRRGKTTPKK
jgi:hypothetical protein